MDEQNTKENIRCRAIIEILGKPKEHVEKTIRDYVNNIKEDGGFIILSENYSDTEEKNNFFSIFVEIELVSKGIDALFGFCFDYMPSSLEIIKPEQFIFPNNIMTGMLNDLQARLHNVDMVVKKLKNENEFLKINLNRALKNHIIIILKMKERTYDEISKLTGISENDLNPYLEQMIKDKEIKKEAEQYFSIK